MTPSRWTLALVAGAALVLAACSNSPNTPKHTTTTTHRSTTTSSSTITSTSGSTTTTGAAGPVACNHVTATAGQGQGAAGTITGVITVTNTGASACTADGYAKMALFSGSGAPLTVTMVNGLSVNISPQASAPASSVTMAPSGKAQFAYQFSDVPTGTETSCPNSEMVSVTMPGATTASPTIALNLDPCNNGTIRVSPVYAPS